MRIGVLGGSFNPPHNGHLIIASDAYEALGLDRLYIIPAAANPLKERHPHAPTAEQRLEMVRLTFGGDGRFEIIYGFLREVDIGDVNIRNVPVYIRKFFDSHTPVDGYLGL